MQDPAPNKKTRLDKWLWHARFFKTRSLAAKIVEGGKVRVNSERVVKPAQSVRPDDVLTFPQAREIRVVRILDIAARRGPASEAQALYQDLTPSRENRPERETVPASPTYEGKGRPTKRDRRKLDLKRGSMLE